MKNTTYYTEYSIDSCHRVKDCNNTVSAHKRKDVKKFSRTWNSKNTKCVYSNEKKIYDGRSVKTQRNWSILM